MNIDVCVVGIRMARQSEMLNYLEKVSSVQQKQYWAQHTALPVTFETAD